MLAEKCLDQLLERHTCFPKSGSSGCPEKRHMLPEKCETVFGQEACNKEVRFSVKGRDNKKARFSVKKLVIKKHGFW